MANRHDIVHRFCNKDWGKNGTLTAGNVSCGTRNYYSYSTVFGQWVDFQKNVCLIYQGSTSVSSSKHQLYKGLFPEDVHVFPYDDGGSSGWHRWHGCNLISYGTFDWHARKTLLNYWIEELYDQFLSIKIEKKKGLEAINYKWWSYVEELCSLYRDTSVSKWLKAPRVARNQKDREMSRMVKLLHKGERDVRTITDAMFGGGTFQRYWDYCARYRKQDDTKAHMENLAKYLHVYSPYGGWYGGKRVGRLSVKQLKGLTAKERIEIKFANLQQLEWNKNENQRIEAYKKRKKNAYKYIVGEEPVRRSSWDSGYNSVKHCVNRFTGQTYNLSNDTDWRIYMPFWTDSHVDFDFDEFRKSEDKRQWMLDFYDKCRIVEINIKAMQTFMEIDANRTGERWDVRYLDDEKLKEATTPEEYAICKDYITRQEQYYVDKEVRERAERIRRQREEEERKREKELQERLKKEQIDECIKQGTEGCRNLWRNHFMEIYDAERRFDETAFADEDFYNGGNVLMRFSLNKNIVETSMRIKLNIPTCKRMWKLVKIWHNDPSKFRNLEIKTLSGTYTIISYENDILTAGCHKIAYAEMERMYNAIIANEKTA